MLQTCALSQRACRRTALSSGVLLAGDVPLRERLIHGCASTRSPRILSCQADATTTARRQFASASWLSYNRRFSAPSNGSSQSLDPSASSSSRHYYCREYSSTTTPPPLSSNPSSPQPIQLNKVLIANRGEIACRVIRTCQKLGLRTVVLYSVQDGPHCTHAVMADEAYLIGTGPAPTDSYLRQDDVLAIAGQTDAQAIHPGYGFLSENAPFAQKCRSAQLTFVGPPPSAITAMGDKAQSKAVMAAAGVPVTPGYSSLDSHDQDAEHLRYQAIHHVGFPLLIKAVAGGGGKGMRLVHAAQDFLPALESCRRESLASFGDASVLLEKYLHQPRHVEVQIMADQYGNVVHLQERDCSLQRRHQKIIEEAPASDLHPSIRAHLGELGKRAAQAVGYVNAGTVEFLLDTASVNTGTSSSATQDDEFPNFYFCEMNTRLQVEHPITELITGVDLVEWQLRIAAGEPLPVTVQDEIQCHGHAFEARIYAENPARNFMPATGTVWHHQPPTTNATTLHDSTTTVRVDTGLRPGQNISVYYDPMISKLIVHGPDRPTALRLLVDSLKAYQIAGVPTNIDFLIKCAQHPTFAKAGAVHTGFLHDHAEDVQVVDDQIIPPPLARVAGSLAVLLQMEGRIIAGEKTSSHSHHHIAAPWSSLWGSWRMGGTAGRAQRVLQLAPREDDSNHDTGIDSELVTTTCTSNRDGSFDLSWVEPLANGDRNNHLEQSGKQQDHEPVSSQQGNVVHYHVNGTLTTDGHMEMVVNGTQRLCLTTVLRKNKNGIVQVRMWPVGLPQDYAWTLDVVDPMAPIQTAATNHADASSSTGRVRSPMPGKIVRIHYNVGDTVPAGSVVVVMEAMKMEHACATPCGGIVTELRCQVGDVVDDGAVLFVVETAPEQTLAKNGDKVNDDAP